MSDIQRLFLGRGFGHTHTMMEGAGSADCVVIVASKQHADHMREKWPRPQYVTIDQIEKLNGLRKPQVIDHFALQALAQKDREAAYRSGIEAAIGKVREMREEAESDIKGTVMKELRDARRIRRTGLDAVINELELLLREGR